MYGIQECRNVDCASVGVLQVCRQLMFVRDLLIFSSAYIMKSSLQPFGSLYTYIYIQPIPRGVTFPKLFQSSKLKARMSLFTETWQKRSSSFEL